MINVTGIIMYMDKSGYGVSYINKAVTIVELRNPMLPVTTSY